MDITDITAPQAPGTTNNNQSPLQGPAAQFDTFLTLLTAQIRNQDPLAPLDSTQFVEQLATFSSLEQQARGNQFLESIAATISQLASNAASDWVGQTVEVESAFVPFEGEPVNFNTEIPASTDRAVLRIADSQGTVIETRDLALGESPWNWDGATNEGARASNGIYQIRIDLFSEGDFTGSLAPRLISEVTEASMENGKIRLGLDNRLTEFADNVRKIK